MGLSSIFKSDTEKLTEAVTKLENLSTQFEALSEEVASNTISSSEFSFEQAAKAIADNILNASEKVKASASFITEAMSAQEEIQNTMVFNFDDYMEKAETALTETPEMTDNPTDVPMTDYYGGNIGGVGGGSGGGYVAPAIVPSEPSDSDSGEDPGEVTPPIGEEDGINQEVRDTIETKFKENGFSDKAIEGIILDAKENNTIASNVGETENGYGIFKWTGTRKDNLLKFAEEKGLDPTDINTQLEFAFIEMTEGTSYTNDQALLVKGLINNAPTVKDAQYLWKTYFINRQ